jgi:hypothetical protein
MLFPGMDQRWLRKAIFALGYQQHGGSGLSFSRDDILKMTIDELEGHIMDVAKQRKREADAMRAAYSKKK